MRETIELEEGDSIAVVRRKLEDASIPRVALLIPPASPLLRSEVHLNLIRRFGEALALDIVLVTRERGVIERARRAGLRTAGTLPEASRMHTVRVAAPKRALPLPPQPPPQPQQSSGWDWAPVQDVPVRSRVALILLALAMVAILGGAAAVALPGATVTLDPVGEQASVEVELTASTQWTRADDQARQVPARLAEITVQGEETGQVTGRQTVQDARATGEVVFANKGTDEVTVPKGTVVSTNDGAPKRFYTLLEATVPGAYGATARVPVMAFEPGLPGNVPALTIRVVEGEPGLYVEVLNDQPLQGGSEKRVPAVSEDDMNRLRASLMQRLQQETYDKFVAGLAQSDWIPPDSLDIQVIEETFDKKLNEQSETLRLVMKVRVAGIAVDGEATRAMLVRLLQVGHTEGLVVNESTLQVQLPLGGASVREQEVRFKAAASALLVPMIDPQDVSRGIAGKGREDAIAWLSARYAFRRPPEVQLQPSWWPRLPWANWRIRVRLAGGL